jgi:preprotein translocase subunit SecF
MKIPNIYEGDYRRCAIIPIIMIVISLFFIPQIKEGVDFRGGTLITLQLNGTVDESALKANLENEGIKDPSVKTYKNPLGNVLEVEITQEESLVRAEKLKSDFFERVDDVSRLESDAARSDDPAVKEKYSKARDELNAMADELFGIAGVDAKASEVGGTNELRTMMSDAYRKANDDYKKKLTSAMDKHVSYSSISFEAVSASLSAKFLEKAITVVIISIIFSITLIFIVFRLFIPSIAVLTGAVCDVTIALGAMGLFGIPLTLASFAALLLLIGYSLDTDVLLTTRVIKRREGTTRERAYDSMLTGITMSTAAIVAFVSLLAVALLTHIPIYYEISSVVVAGLIGDIFATWGINAVIVLWYMEGKETPEQKTKFTSVFKR